jgi:hypothetical protein
MAEGGFFGRIRAGLQKTRQALKERLETVFTRPRVDSEPSKAPEEAIIRWGRRRGNGRRCRACQK